MKKAFDIGGDSTDGMSLGLQKLTLRIAEALAEEYGDSVPYDTMIIVETMKYESNA